MSVVHVLNSTYSRDPHLMHLIRILVFLAACFDFWFQAQHIEGKYNNLADALSRNNVQASLFPDSRSFIQNPSLPHISLLDNLYD